MTSTAKVLDFYTEIHKKRQVFIDISDHKVTVRTLQNDMWKDKRTNRAIALGTNLSPQTVSNMRYKITQSPHHRTTHALLKFYGYKTVAIR